MRSQQKRNLFMIAIRLWLFATIGVIAFVIGVTFISLKLNIHYNFPWLW